MYQEKINKLDKAIASPNTPKEFIHDLKKRRLELEKEQEEHEKKIESERLQAEKMTHEKLSKQRKQLKSGGDIRPIRKPVKAQVKVLKKKKVASTNAQHSSNQYKYKYVKGGCMQSTSRDHRLVNLTLANGEIVSIAQAAYLSDRDIHKRYKIGDKFDTFGKDGKQEIIKVEIVYKCGGKIGYEKGGISYAKGVQTGRCPVGTKVQTLLFDKKKFSESEAVSWARKHDYHTSVDIKPNIYRLRQAPPFKFKKGSFRTISFEPGIEAVIACPK